MHIQLVRLEPSHGVEWPYRMFKAAQQDGILKPSWMFPCPEANQVVAQCRGCIDPVSNGTGGSLNRDQRSNF